MKKILVYSFIPIAVLAIIVGLFIPHQVVRYPIGRDTVKTYGDGEYQILKGPTSSYSLYNSKYGTNLVETIEVYKRVDNTLYVLGMLGNSKIFVIIDIKSNFTKLYVLLDSNMANIYFINQEKMLSDGAIKIIYGESEMTEQEKNMHEKMKDK